MLIQPARAQFSAASCCPAAASAAVAPAMAAPVADTVRFAGGGDPVIEATFEMGALKTLRMDTYFKTLALAHPRVQVDARERAGLFKSAYQVALTGPKHSVAALMQDMAADLNQRGTRASRAVAQALTGYVRQVERM